MKQSVRTVKLKLFGDFTKINQVIPKYLEAINWFSKIIFERKRVENPNSLAKEFYKNLREFNVPSQVCLSLIRHVVSNYRTMKSNKKWNQAEFTSQTIPLCWKRDFNISRRGLTIWNVPFIYQSRPIPQGKWSDSRLKCIEGQWYLILSVTVEIPELKTEGCIVGVDSGIKNVFAAVNSNDGKTFYFRSNSLNHRRSCLRTVRSQVASVGTPSSKRLLKRLSGREKSVTQEILHLASKKLVIWANEVGARTIVMEDLTNIRESSLKKGKEYRAKIHRWPFLKARFFVEYKANAKGIDFELVNPAYTSQRCPQCGHTVKANRRGLLFHCKACGIQDNSDRIGGRNVSLRSVLGRQAFQERAALNRLIVANSHNSVTNLRPCAVGS